MKKVHISSAAVALILSFGCIPKSEAHDLTFKASLDKTERNTSGLTFQVQDKDGKMHDIGHIGDPQNKTAGKHLVAGTYKIKIAAHVDEKLILAGTSYQYSRWYKGGKYKTMTCHIGQTVKSMKRIPIGFKAFSFLIVRNNEGTDTCIVTASGV